IHVNRKDFVDNVLKQYNKTLYEWKEDVLKIEVLMRKMCKDDVKVTDDDVQQAFVAEFGPKVDVQIIIWPKGQDRFARQMFEKIRSSDEEFERAARQQAAASLAATGGRIKPFGRGAGTHAEVEKEAFMLKPGEISRLIGTPEGTVCFKLIKNIPADETAKLDDHRERLKKQINE